MDRLFNMDNKFFTVMGRVADLIMLNVVFLICCLPIVTIGASLTALHYVTLKMARNEESYIIRSFFKSFKQNFKQATVINLIMLAVASYPLHGSAYCRQYRRNNVSGTVYRFLCIWYPLYDGISVYLSGACQILQLHQKHLPQCIPDGYPSSSVYSPDGSHHSVTCRRVFYQKFPHTVHGHHASVHVWICTGGIYQRTFSGKDF